MSHAAAAIQTSRKPVLENDRRNQRPEPFGGEIDVSRTNNP